MKCPIKTKTTSMTKHVCEYGGPNEELTFEETVEQTHTEFSDCIGEMCASWIDGTCRFLCRED